MLLGQVIMRTVVGGIIGPKVRSLSLPSVVFALAFVLLGWIASHSITYALVDLAPHGHHEADEWYVHGYMSALEFAGGLGLVLGFGLALRAFFRHGSFGGWLRDGGVAGTRRQAALATILPTAVFVLSEYLERLAAGTGTSPTARLLAVGVFVQLLAGLLCLALARVTLRVAERVIGSLGRGLLVRPGRRDADPVLEDVVFARPRCPMADSRAGRAPPISTVSC